MMTDLERGSGACLERGVRTYRRQFALVEDGQIYLWERPGEPAQLSADPPARGAPRAPLRPPAAACAGVVTRLGPEGYARFEAVEDPAQQQLVKALFTLRRRRLTRAHADT